jgi:hypothetical protein
MCFIFSLIYFCFSITMKRKSNLIASSTTRHKCKPTREKVGGYFPDLPSSITTHILLQLPIKAVSICKCVCKTWNAMISDSYFATLYFERASLGLMIRNADSGRVSNTLHLFEYQPENLLRVVYTKFDPKFKLPLRNANTTCHLPSYHPEDDKFAVVNSCNGLLCLREPDSVNHLVVCNQITGEFIRLPETAPNRKPICVGFGFQPKTNEYKVIRMWKIYDRWCSKSDVMAAEVHTLGTTTWRNVEVDPKFSYI